MSYGVSNMVFDDKAIKDCFCIKLSHVQSDQDTHIDAQKGGLNWLR